MSSIHPHLPPLATLLRPQSLDTFIGQRHLLGSQGILNSWLQQNSLPHALLWGPPGCGKTTLAYLLAKTLNHTLLAYGGSQFKTKTRQNLLKTTTFLWNEKKQKTLVFIDEIHRLNRIQQDSLLPLLEKKIFLFLAATTENPAFALQSALLSRLQTLPLYALSTQEAQSLLDQALSQLQKTLSFRPLSLLSKQTLIERAQGDGRRLLSLLEMLLPHLSKSSLPLSPKTLLSLLPPTPIRYDKAQDMHYELISALIKSMRASDTQASVYYLARMLEGGEDPGFLFRRLLIFASEDIGLADPHAFVFAHAAQQAFEKVGLPEGEIILTHCVLTLCRAPKNRSVIQSLCSAKKEIQKTGPLPPPFHLINFPHAWVKKTAQDFPKSRLPHDQNKNLPKKVSQTMFFKEP